MKKTFLLPVAIGFLAVSQFSNAQTRFTSEVYTNVKVSSNVVYGNNKSVLTGSPVSTDLKMDVYEAVGDTMAKRPLIIFLHTGGFLPFPINQSPTGTKTDSAVVEICKQFAKRGYVAAAMTYRLGWNPQTSNQDTLTSTLLNAVYRAVQDVRTGVRYFKKEAKNGNAFKIDSTKIIVGGMGSGGYVSLACASLNKTSEIQLAKFINFNVTPNAPYVNQAVSGDFEGLGGNPAANTPNWPGYSSKISMVFNMGGALGDASWMEAGEVPVVSFHCKLDPFAPYTSGIVTVPTTGQSVINVTGSHDAIKKVNELGNNKIFVDAKINDAFSIRANKINDGYEGLFPFVLPPASTPILNQSAPWEWWASSNQNHTTGLYNNPDMSKTKALAYIDTIMGYLNPRIALVLKANATGINEMELEASAVSVYPNPSNGEFTVALNEGNDAIKSIEMTDITGRLVFSEKEINNSQYAIKNHSLNTGIYFVKLKIGDKIALKKVIIE